MLGLPDLVTLVVGVTHGLVRPAVVGGPTFLALIRHAQLLFVVASTVIISHALEALRQLCVTARSITSALDIASAARDTPQIVVAGIALAAVCILNAFLAVAAHTERFAGAAIVGALALDALELHKITDGVFAETIGVLGALHASAQVWMTQLAIVARE
jgi:hypothetical protein